MARAIKLTDRIVEEIKAIKAEYRAKTRELKRAVA